MAKDKYEISLWEDYEVAADGTIPAHYEERKIAIIGSDTMTSPCRALEPKLIENINGTNTFTFKMFYLYDISDIEEARARGILNSDLTWVTDDKERTKYRNPFESLLVNERKVKVYWKKKWYDLVVKNIQEDSSGRSVVYTCKDLFINELSKTGFDLEFDNELENNQGSAPELVKKVLEGTDWRFGNGDTIQQEKPVFEGNVKSGFSAQNQTKGNITEAISNNNTTILVYYQQVQDFLTGNDNPTSFQFAYASKYQRDTNSQLVINADCYIKSGISFNKTTINNVKYIDIKEGNTTIVRFVEDAISTQYRASRLVQSQICKLDPLTGKYCYVYKATTTSKPNYKKGDEIYMYRSTEYKDATFVNDLIINGSGFTSTTGWSTTDDSFIFDVYPPFSEVTDWSSIPYLRFKSGVDYINYGIRQNSNFIPDGFKNKEKYILRFKAMSNSSGKPSGNYVTNTTLTISIKDNKNVSYFADNPTRSRKGNWIEYELVCNRSITRAEI